MRTTLRLVPISLLAASTAFGDTPLTEQIIVTGFRTEHSVLDSPAAVSVITREEIEQSGALTIADVLRARAGLQVRDAIGDGGRGVIVSMRGFGENAANNTLILVDGRRLNNPTLASPDLNTVSIGDIERIEILQGGGGVLFGDQAVGGVINIVTRPTDDGTIAVEAGGGSYDQRRASVSASGRMANGFGGRVSAEHREADNFRKNNASDFDNVLGMIEYRTDATRVFAEAQYTDDRLEFPGSLSEPELSDDRDTSLPLYAQDFGNQETDLYRIGGRHAFGPNWAAEVELSERDMDGEGVLYGAPNTTEMSVRTASPRLVGEFPVRAGNALITLGVDWTDSSYLLDIPAYFLLTDFDQEMLDSYAQLVFPLIQDVQFSAGARRSEVEDHNRGADQENKESETITTASLSWKFRDDMRLLVRRDEVLRYANVDENALPEAGSDFLSPQVGVSLEGGLEWFGSRLTGRAMLFDMDLEDEILYDPTAIPRVDFGFPGANANRDSRRRGVLVESRWQASEAWSFEASYTYTEAELTEGEFDGQDVPYVSPHTAAVSATWAIGGGLSLFGEYAYNSSRYALGDNANDFAKVDSEGLANMALRWESGPWHATLRGNNLFNEEYETLSTNYGFGMSGYPAPERAVFLGVGYAM